MDSLYAHLTLLFLFLGAVVLWVRELRRAALAGDFNWIALLGVVWSVLASAFEVLLLALGRALGKW